MMVFENYPTAPRRVAELEMASLPLPTDAANFALMLALGEDRDGLSGRLTYDSDLFDAATMTRLAADYAALLAQVAASPDLALAGFALAPDAGDRGLANSFNEVLEA